MKRWQWLSVSILVPFLVAACAPAAQPPPPTTAPAKPAVAPAKPAAEKPAANVPAQTIELVLGHFVPTKHEMHARLMEPWAKELEQKSNGRIKVTIHPGGALGPPPAQYQNVVGGAMDVGFGLPTYTPGRFPLTSAVELPFVWQTGVQATRALWELYETTPELQKEYADVKVLALWTHGLGEILTTKKQVKTLQDVNGLKLRTPGSVQNKLVEAMGATPLNAPAPELYDILERGVADGAVITPSSFIGFRLGEVVKYSTVGARLYVAPFFLVMNKQKWQSLPPDVQELIDEVSGEKLALRGGQVYDETEKEGIELAKKNGVTFSELPPAELEKFHAAAATVSEQWIKETQAKGLPAKELYEKMLSLAKGEAKSSY